MKGGINLTGITSYGSNIPFKNVFRCASWGPAKNPDGSYHLIYPHVYPTNDFYGVPIPEPTFDADAYPTNHSGQGRYGDQVFYYNMPDLPAGTMTLRAQGTGTWKLAGKAAGVDFALAGTFGGNASTSIPLPAGLAGTQLQLLSSSPADHVRDLRFMLPGCSPDDTQVFNDRWIDTLTGFSVLRTMDFQETNGDAVTSWASRPSMSLQCWASENLKGGVPVETFGELAARTGSDLWINIPSRATDDYCTQLGTLLASILPSTCNLHVEFGNELWNSGTFFTAVNLTLAGKATGLYPGHVDFDVQLRYYARRARQVTRLVQQAFGAASARVRPVLASQNAYALNICLDEWLHYGVEPGVATRPAAPLATPNAPPYAGSIGGYIGQDLSDPAHIGATKAGGVDGIIGALNGVELTQSRAYLADFVAVCVAAGTLPVVYEGGFENMAINAIEDAVMVALAIAANRDPRIGGCAAAHLASAASVGVALFMWFSHLSPPTKYGSYGLLEYLWPVATWPKYDAVHGYAVAAAGGSTPTPPAPTPSLPGDLLAAIQAVYDADPLAGEMVLYTRKAADGATAPYAILAERGSTTELKTSTVDCYSLRLSLKVYADDLDAAGDLGDRIDPVLNDVAYVFAGGQAAPFVRAGEPRHDKDGPRSKTGEGWYQERVYDCRVIRRKGTA